MLGYIAPLWTVGVVCLTAAVVGKAVKLGGSELPAIPSGRARLALALIGTIAIVLGMALFLRPPDTTGPTAESGGGIGEPTPEAPPEVPPAEPTAEPSAPPSDPPSTEPPSVEPTEEAPDPLPVPSPNPVEVQWEGTIALDAEKFVTGWFLDPVPPSRAPLGDLGLVCGLGCNANELAGNTIAEWDAAKPPSRRQCVDLLNTRLGQRSVAVRTGTMGCVGTEGGRVGFFHVTDTPGSGRMDLVVRVWERP